MARINREHQHSVILTLVAALLLGVDLQSGRIHYTRRYLNILALLPAAIYFDQLLLGLLMNSTC